MKTQLSKYLPNFPKAPNFSKVILLSALFFLALTASSQPNEPGSGNALSFDGVDDYVDCGNNGVLNPGIGSWTISAWVKISDFSGINNIMNYPIVSKADGDFDNGYFISITTDNNVNPRKVNLIFDYAGGPVYQIQSLTVLLPNKWYKVTGILDRNSNKIKLYINGILENQANGPGVAIINPSSSLRLSWYDRYTVSKINYLNGQIDEVRIWNYARSQAEIRRDMCRKLTGNEPGLIGYWRFDEGSGNTAFDSSPNANDGTLY